ncbi:MAG TPA: carbonate dehydratase [Pseudomonadales bacterium]|nr:carbonate dehydratase [Pseudomonadales bacterium]
MSEQDPTSVQHLIQLNRQWSERIKSQDPEFFQKLSQQQAPEYLWIGCSDSRVPANEIVGLLPGELFVHRNVANIVVNTDMNCLSVIQYAVEVLKVKHILVVGHYGCGGVRAALENKELGLIDNWLRNLRDIALYYREELDGLSTLDEKAYRLCELNVIAQVNNVANSTIVQNAWRRGQALTIHGWVYSLRNGMVKDMKVSISGLDQVSPFYLIEY